jgi:hypothetical protein
VDAHLQEFQAAGEALWPAVATEMQAQAYGEWHTMLRESLVRASVVRYRAANEGREAAKAEIAEQRSRHFRWTGDLAALLEAEYEGDRSKYRTLEDFVPRLVEFFAEYAKGEAARQAKAPKVVSLLPAATATGVDPGLKALAVTFDRPMQDGSWAVVGGGPKFPKIAGRLSYDAARKVLTIPVELQPGTSYEMWLNRGKYDSFRSEDGVPLASVHWTFTTRAP